jgi:plastocyanin
LCRSVPDAAFETPRLQEVVDERCVMRLRIGDIAAILLFGVPACNGTTDTLGPNAFIGGDGTQCCSVGKCCDQGGGGGGGGIPAGTVAVADIEFRSARNGTSNPAIDTVAVGDSVTWTWVGSLPHSVQSFGEPGFESSDIMINGRHVVTFTAAGTYRYDCAVHGSAMTGRVVVR